MGRDSGFSSIRENSILDFPRREREISMARSDSGRESRLNSSPSVAETLAEMRNKYSPANYVPAIHRKNDISRSKSINDIGLPPLEKKKVIDSLNSNSVGVSNYSNSTNKDRTDNGTTDDDNGNRPSVSEIRKKFDSRAKPASSSPAVEGSVAKIYESRFKKQDSVDAKIENGVRAKNTPEKNTKPTEVATNGVKIHENGIKPLQNSVKASEDKLKANDVEVKKWSSEIDKKLFMKDEKVSVSDFDRADSEVLPVSLEKSKLKVSKHEASVSNGAMLGGSGSSVELRASDAESGESLKNSRTNNFASYISTKDFNKGDSRNEEATQVDSTLENGYEMDSRKAKSSRYYVSCFFLFHQILCCI